MLFGARSPAPFFFGFFILIRIRIVVLWASAVRRPSIRARLIVPVKIDAQVIWMIVFFFEVYQGDFGVRWLRWLRYG